MHIEAIIASNLVTPELLGSLFDEKRKFHQTDRILAVRLPNVGDENSHKFKILEYLPECDFNIVACEEGGAHSGYGRSCIVTNPFGSLMAPFRRRRTPWPNGAHADFGTYTNMDTIRARWGEGNPKIRINELSMSKEEEGILGLISEPLYSFVWQPRRIDFGIQLPPEMQRFKLAAKAAAKKSLCRDCSETHFALPPAQAPRLQSLG